MAYCPECGEKISDTDTFCAYCGIALQPTASASVVPDQPAPDAPESAPAVEAFAPAPASSEINEMAVSALPPSSEIQDPAEPLPAPLEGFGLNPFAQNPANESSNLVAESSAANADSDFGLPITAPKIEIQQAPSEPELQQVEPSAAVVDAIEIEPAAGLSPPEQISPTNESAPEFAPAPAPENIQTPPSDFAAPASGTQNAAPSEDAYNADFEQTVPYIPADFMKKNTAAHETPAAAKGDAQPPAGQPDSGYASFSSIPTPSRADAIAKPEIPVESSPHDSLEPKLVSVNILPEFDSAAKKGGENDFAAAASPPAPERAAPEKERQARSHTSPNIGVTETDGKKSAKLKPLEEGTVLNGRYEIIRKIGGGGMGAVYLASDRNLGGVLRAVKEMVQSYIEDAQQEKAVNDFRRESLLLTSLEHPSIPTIFDYFYDEKECRFYLVMKYISGGDLAARLRSAPEGRVDEKSVTEWAIQIADVLDYLHNRQPPIVYRDLKPSNVMIDGNSGRVMIIDFGIARWVNKEEKGVTAVGTMGYAPPELFSGNVEPRSDIYSLGSTMFHLLTGADPQSNPLLIFDFHKNPRPRQINSRLSDQIEAILVRAVEYNAEQRFRSAAELRETLSAHLENLKKGTVTYGAGEAAKATPAAASQPVFCGFCGQKILITDLFCPFCGAQQPLAAGNPSASLKPAFAAAKQTARLLVIGTNDLNAPQFTLDKDNSLVGRRDPMSNIFPEVDLSKFDPQTKISRRHARIWRESNVYMLEDLGSSNGTVLLGGGARENLRLLPHQPHALAHGDKIRVGDTMLHFFVG